MGKPRVSRRALFCRPAVTHRVVAVRTPRLFLAAALLLALGLAGGFPTGFRLPGFRGETALAAELTSGNADDLGIPTGRQPLDEHQLAAVIDNYFAHYWQRHGIEPAAAADDAELLRRVSLDLVGKIPSVSQARTFLDNPNPNKRAELIESLLEEGACATHFANLWRATLLGGAADDQQIRAGPPARDLAHAPVRRKHALRSAGP